MANLGAIALELPDSPALAGVVFPFPATVRSLVLIDCHPMQYGAGRDDSVGGAAAPSFKMTGYGKWAFAMHARAGARTVSAMVRQTLPESPRPQLRVLASPSLGLNADVVATAPAGTGWVTVGPAAFSVTTAGMIWVELWCLAHGTAVACWWDDIEAT